MIRWVLLGCAVAAMIWVAYPNNIGVRAAVNVSAMCNDMSLSYSVNRSGTCSHRGGVREWVE